MRYTANVVLTKFPVNDGGSKDGCIILSCRSHLRTTGVAGPDEGEGSVR